MGAVQRPFKSGCSLKKADRLDIYEAKFGPWRAESVNKVRTQEKEKGPRLSRSRKPLKRHRHLHWKIGGSSFVERLGRREGERSSGQWSGTQDRGVLRVKGKMKTVSPRGVARRRKTLGVVLVS